jgi:hypothetical protein
MSDFKLITPVVLIIFNRPDTTERVFAEIAKAKPPKLLVVGDGPRVGREGEAKKVAETRGIINKVDWPCEVLTNYSDANLGCKNRVSSGIDWVFDQVEEAIILEDDCVPHQSFFRFSQELLSLYRNDSRIGMICGTNMAYKVQHNESYFYSRIPRIWGWATWRRVWKTYDVEFKGYTEIGYIHNLINSFKLPSEGMHWVGVMDAVLRKEINTWDAQVLHMVFRQSYLSIFPSGNLVSNIGFRQDATHTKNNDGEQANLEYLDIKFPLKHPSYILPCYESDNINRRINKITPAYRNMMKKLIRKLSRIFI